MTASRSAARIDPASERTGAGIENRVRSFPVRSHIIYYRVAAHCVQTLRAGHGARDARALLSVLDD